MKILFVIPTLFENKKHTEECIDSLVQSINNQESKIVVVINQMNEEFDKWEPKHSCVVKKNSNLLFNISKAVNTGLEERSEEEYFCFVDEGMRFSNGWISEVLEVYNNEENVGTIGFKGHSTFNHYNKKIRENLYEVLWTDGILFTKFDRLDKVGLFDEDYFGDCETQDFCYRLMENGGYTNYLLKTKNLNHKIVGWSQKSKKSSDLISLASKSRKLFGNRWESWRRSRYLNQ